MGFPHGSDGQESACNERDQGLIPGHIDPVEKGIATQSSVLAWRIPWARGAWWAIIHEDHKELYTIEQFHFFCVCATILSHVKRLELYLEVKGKLQMTFRDMYAGPDPIYPLDKDGLNEAI